MTINGLTINDRIVARFKATCTQHHGNGGPPICHQARVAFFADLKQEYGGMENVIPHLEVLFLQLNQWETEVRNPPLPAGHE